VAREYQKSPSPFSRFSQKAAGARSYQEIFKLDAEIEQVRRALSICENPATLVKTRHVLIRTGIALKCDFRIEKHEITFQSHFIPFGAHRLNTFL
jgi:hypothetical protein